MTVGIAVPTTVASSAARNIPVMTPIVTARRLREDITSVCAPSDTEWLSIRFGDDTTLSGAAVCALIENCETKDSLNRTASGCVLRQAGLASEHGTPPPPPRACLF